MGKEKLMKFAGEQCKIFPEDSEMGKYLRETLKMLQAGPCEDAISKKDMYFKLTNGAYPNETIEQFIDRLVKELEDMPPVKPTRKKGKWIDIMVGDMPAQACDQCNTFYPLAYTGGGHKYCPNCGSFMMGSNEE